MSIMKPISRRIILGIIIVLFFVGNNQSKAIGYSETLSFEKTSSSSSHNNQYLDLFSEDLFIQKLSYTVHLTTSSSASTQIEMTIQNQGNETLTFIESWLNGSYSSFFAYDAYGNLPFSWKKQKI